MHESAQSSGLEIRQAGVDDVPILLDFVRALAEYEKLAHEVTATEESLRDSLFGPKPMAEALLGFSNDEPVCFAVYFFNYSTFLGKRGMYLEDLFVKPAHRGLGFGKAILMHLASLALEQGCGRFEWSVIDWNQGAIEFYKGLGATILQDWRICRLSEAALKRLTQI